MNENSDLARELLANHDDPWLGVNLLSEFVFCPRAGLIESERSREDVGEDEEPPASVSYMPPHEISDIVWRIEQTTRGMARWLPVPAAACLITMVLAWRLGWVPAMAGLFVTACLAKPIFTSLEELRKLKELLAFAESRKPVVPDPKIEANQDVNWWELRKAHFEPVKPPRGLEDDATHLIGKPWRILTREGMQIPVFKKRIDGPNPTTVYRQHYARMAAYCYLLERATGAESPYGIILFGYTYTGVALNAKASRRHFREGLLAARQAIKDSQNSMLPPAPDPPDPCRGCPHGKPSVKKTSTADSGDGNPKTIGADGREYHSDCGDRFGWVPPHERAEKKQLRRA